MPSKSNNQLKPKIMATINFPELKGSAKQIAWAEDIRKQMLSLTYRGTSYENLVGQILAMDEAKRAQLAAIISKNPYDELATVYGVATQDSAAWFIENRPHASYKFGSKTVMSY